MSGHLLIELELSKIDRRWHASIHSDGQIISGDVLNVCQSKAGSSGKVRYLRGLGARKEEERKGTW